MVGKIYNGLFLLFFIALLIFCGNNLQEAVYDEITNRHFNATVYLDTAIDQESSIQTLQAIAEEYQLTIAKVIPNEGGGTDIFVYAADDQYLRELLSSDTYIRASKPPAAAIGAPDAAPAATQLQSFYKREIFVRPLEDLKNRGVDGRYALHVDNAADVADLVETINAQYVNELTLYPNQNLRNTFVAPVNLLKYYYSLILLAILFMTLLTSFLYDLKSRKKSIAVKRLLGYNTGAIFYDIFIGKILKPALICALAAELLAIAYFALNGNIRDLATLLFFLGPSLKYALFAAAGVMAVMALFLVGNVARKFRHTYLVAHLKGMETSRNTLSLLVKMGSTFIILVVFGVLFVNWGFVAGKKEAAPYWETTKDNVVLNIYVPQQITQDKKLSAQFEQTHRAIWSFLNDKDGILFYQTTDKLNESPVVVDGREVQVPFAYINQNYLREIPVFDRAGDRVGPIDESDDNVLNVLIPAAYEPYEDELRAVIHRKHVYDKYISEDIQREWISGQKNATDLSVENLDDPAITERLIYIGDDQVMFTYTVGGDFVVDAVLAVVNGENMGGNVYTPSLSLIQAKSGDVDALNRETRELFNRLGYGAVDSDYSSVYLINADDLQFSKSIIGFSTVVFVLSLVFVVLSLLFYVEVYYLRNKRKIAIKQFLGFSFFSRNNTAFISLLVQDMLIIALGLAAGAFIEGKVIGINITPSIVAFGAFVLLFDIWCAALTLKRRESKFIVKTLKGE